MYMICTQKMGALLCLEASSGDRGRSIIAAAERHGALDIAEFIEDNQQQYTTNIKTWNLNLKDNDIRRIE